jgi:hypothetical protein
VFLQINIDVLPLFKSSNMQLCPVLCLIKQPEVANPFVEGVFCGTSKLTVTFLDEFFDELKLLMSACMSVGKSRLQI